MIQIQLSIDGDPDIATQLTRWLEGLEMLESHEIVVEAPHAGHIEFGTHPVEDKSRRYTKSSDSPTYQAIAEWFAIRNGTSADSLSREQRDIVGRIYRNLMNGGLFPLPFFRPGYYEVLDDIAPDDEPSEWLNEGDHSIRLMAEMMADNMRSIIEENDMLVTHELYESIDVRRIENTTIPDDTDSVDEDVWLSRVFGADHKPPNKRYKMR